MRQFIGEMPHWLAQEVWCQTWNWAGDKIWADETVALCSENLPALRAGPEFFHGTKAWVKNFHFITRDSSTYLPLAFHLKYQGSDLRKNALTGEAEEGLSPGSSTIRLSWRLALLEQSPAFLPRPSCAHPLPPSSHTMMPRVGLGRG